MPSESPDNENFEAHAEGNGNPWPCMVMMLIACLTFLGTCFAGVYLVVNMKQ